MVITMAKLKYEDLDPDTLRKLANLAKENKNGMKQVVEYMKKNNIGRPQDARDDMRAKGITIKKTTPAVGGSKEAPKAQPATPKEPAAEKKLTRAEKKKINQEKNRQEQAKRAAERKRERTAEADKKRLEKEKLAEKQAKTTKARATTSGQTPATKTAEAKKPEEKPKANTRGTQKKAAAKPAPKPAAKPTPKPAPKTAAKPTPKPAAKPAPKTTAQTPAQKRKATMERKKMDRRLAMVLESETTKMRDDAKKAKAEEAKKARARNVGPQSPPKVTKDVAKLGSTAGKTTSTLGKLLRGATGPAGAVISALSAEKLGDAELKPGMDKNKFLKKIGALGPEKKGRGDGASEVAARKERTKQIKDALETKKKQAAASKARAADKAGVEARKEAARKENAKKTSAPKKTAPVSQQRSVDTKRESNAAVEKRRAELKAHNKRIMSMTPAERKAYRESEAGKKGTLLKNRGGSASKYSMGGVIKANCGASMAPNRKSKS